MRSASIWSGRSMCPYDPKHETLVTVGGSEAIDIGLRCMLDPGG